MRWRLALLALAGALAGCGHRDAPDPGGLSPEDAQLMNNAAAMLDDNGSAAPGNS